VSVKIFPETFHLRGKSHHDILATMIYYLYHKIGQDPRLHIKDIADRVLIWTFLYFLTVDTLPLLRNGNKGESLKGPAQSGPEAGSCAGAVS
jgi:hypothetical protein